MKNILIGLFSFSLFCNADYLDYVYQNRAPTSNSFGQTGLIQTPSAEIKGENSIFLTLNKNDIYKFATLTVSPFDWMEASYFYYQPEDFIWGGLKGKYLDKGFNVKVNYKPNNKFLPTNVAIGLDDFAGTGFFSREYIVGTYDLNSFKFTLGLGWGKYATENAFSNPFSKIITQLDTRPNPNLDIWEVGRPSFNQWFRGDIGLFGGFEIFLPFSKGLKLKVENDPFNYFDFSANFRSDSSPLLREKDSELNIGISFPINDFITSEISFIKGNSVNLSFVIGKTFNKSPRKKNFNPIIEKRYADEDKEREFYNNLLYNLSKNSLYLQTAHIDNKKLDLTIDNAKFTNSIQSTSRAAYFASKTAELSDLSLETINVSTIMLGNEMHIINYDVADLKISNVLPAPVIQKRIIVSSPSSVKEYKKHEFQPSVKFPIFFNNIKPDLRTHVGSPERFIYEGLGLSFQSEVQLSRNLLFNLDIGHSFDDDFDEKNPRPASDLPHVRTEIISYLQETDNYLTTAKFDYFWSPKPQMFFKTSIGIFEMMYAGYGMEYLYKPFKSNFLVGFELYDVKRRTFDQNFDLLDYRVQTGHMNFTYYFENSGITLKTSYGKYLAKDKGFTFDLSRRSSNGFEAGFYFSLTDVPAEIFGEGSFDKGFYFEIPYDLFSNIFSKETFPFSYKPLTRDGGQKLNNSNDLISLYKNDTKSKILEGANGFLD